MLNNKTNHARRLDSETLSNIKKTAFELLECLFIEICIHGFIRAQNLRNEILKTFKRFKNIKKKINKKKKKKKKKKKNSESNS